MKSRLTILAMLVAGMLLCTTGAGLAVSGLSSSGNASSAAGYPDEQPAGAAPGGVRRRRWRQRAALRRGSGPAGGPGS